MASLDQTSDSEVTDGNENCVSSAVPKVELVMNRLEVSSEEKDYHRDYFEGKVTKTPERYLKIRNYILDSWEKMKPNYLNKTSARSGLKNCGDVNCIGRIHEYLEMVGAINFGCEQACYNRPQTNWPSEKPQRTKVQRDNEDENIVQKHTGRLRKRKLIPDLSSESAAEGYTIEHLPNGEVVVQTALPHSSVTKPSSKRTINPFKLITPAKFTEKKAPFEVSVCLEALVVMDIHSHLSRAEVIGLLGGHFHLDRQTVEVVLAEPCLSLSTGMQCEMDPVSQTEASSYIEDCGLSVVGWYHSHPTFPPNPSLRDLETQEKYQEWFGRRGNPFVALILTPYSPDPCSQFRCMTVGEETIFDSYRKPYQLPTNIVKDKFSIPPCLKQLKKVSERIPFCLSRIPLWVTYEYSNPPITYLSKMLQSVKHHLDNAGVQLNLTAELCQEIQNIFKDNEK